MYNHGNGQTDIVIMVSCSSFESQYLMTEFQSEIYIDEIKRQLEFDEFCYSLAENYLSNSMYSKNIILDYGHMVKLGRILHSKEMGKRNKIRKT